MSEIYPSTRIYKNMWQCKILVVDTYNHEQNYSDKHIK